MTDEPLPKQADLRKLATREAHFCVSFKAANLPRFAATISSGDSVITVDLQFGIDEQRIRSITGIVSGDVEVVCQRCMKPVAIHVHSDVCLGIVWDEIQAKQLPKAMDPIIVAEDELIDLNEVVEDELLLSMPFVSYHEPSECSAQQSYEFSSDDIVEPEEDKENPFSVLEQLKTSKE